MLNCYIGLGSNLEEPRQQVSRAISELATFRSSALIRVSSLYHSKAIGPKQADYINAVAELETTQSASELLVKMQELESAHGRVRLQHWGPRTLDLDLLLYGHEQINNKQLTVPHPEMINRNFVLIPLYEIAAELTIPGMGKLADLVAQIDHGGVEIIDPNECRDE